MSLSGRVPCDAKRLGGLASLLLGSILLAACGNRPPDRGSARAAAELVQATSIPRLSTIPTLTPSPSPPRATATAPPTVVYTVQPGDTLRQIATQFGVSAACLVAANEIANPDLIMPGQQLLIPPCDGAPVPPQPAPPGESPTPTSAYPQMPTGLAEAIVLAIVDGDTIDVRLSHGQVVRLRLIGIDAPETLQPGTPVQCYALEAAAKARDLLEGQAVLLEADPSQGEWDEYGRLLRYVWFPDGRLYNLEMIAQGYAHEYTFEKPYKYQAEFLSVETRARTEGLGFWSPLTCGGDTERPADLSTPTALPVTTLHLLSTPGIDIERKTQTGACCAPVCVKATPTRLVRVSGSNSRALAESRRPSSQERLA